jgi:D-arabinose 1-dehydrogenase-like Zn-dependent alcohol dehydrogenase
VFPWIGCGQCDACGRGLELMCEMPRTIGTRKNGGYSDYTLVPDQKYVVEYGAVDAKLAATAACSGLTAYSAIKKLPALDADDFVVIIGAGGVGLAGVGLLKALTPANVVAVDISSEKRAAALSAGADIAIDGAAENPLADIRRACSRAPRAVIDFVGMEKTAGLGMDILGRSGHLIVVGLYGGEIPISVSSLAMRNITLQGSNVGTLADLSELLGLMSRTNLKTIPVQGRPMSEVNDVLAEVAQGAAVGRIALQTAVS